MERSIDEVARLTGLTTRTLRHYDGIGLVRSSSTGPGGRRRYDAAALVRLQRVLLLRDLGLGLAEIGTVVDGDEAETRALRRHLDQLRIDRSRLARRIHAVASTIDALERGEPPMAEDMFDGFDPGAHRAEVTERWGAASWAAGDDWWRGLGDDGRAAFRTGLSALQEEWADAARRRIRPDSHEAHALAARQVDWLSTVPGTPTGADYVRGLGEMYAADERFTAQYGGADGAAFVRDALAVWADAHSSRVAVTPLDDR